MLVLLDRDGVINQDRREGILSLDKFVFMPRAKEAIAMLTKAGFQIAICTNQSAVGRGNLKKETLDAIHDYMLREVRAAGGDIARVYYAPDCPEAPTERRKPGAGMLLEALHDLKGDPRRTPMVGDMLRDMEAAHKAGCPRILVYSGNGRKTVAAGIPEELEPVAKVADLYEAAEHILAHYTGEKA